jgi:hypothetical protein
MVERLIIVCLTYFQQTTPPHNVNTYPLVNFVSSVLEIQLASLNPSTKQENQYNEVHNQ